MHASVSQQRPFRQEPQPAHRAGGRTKARLQLMERHGADTKGDGGMREAVQLKKRLEIEEDHLNRLVAVCEGRFNPKYKRSGDVKKDIQSARNEAAEVFAFLAEADN